MREIGDILVGIFLAAMIYEEVIIPRFYVRKPELPKR